MFIWETHKKMPSDLHDRLVSAIGDDSSHYINYDGHSGVSNATYENVQNEYFTSYLDDDFSLLKDLNKVKLIEGESNEQQSLNFIYFNLPCYRSFYCCCRKYGVYFLLWDPLFCNSSVNRVFASLENLYTLINLPNGTLL